MQRELRLKSEEKRMTKNGMVQEQQFMMQKPLLSICIPTYNRSKYLKKGIESIICQEEFLNGMVEIVISDNCSDDDTGLVVNKYTDKYNNIFYNRNPENVRDKNHLIVLSEAHGLLRKLCNDTLLFQTGSLKQICEIIENNKKQRPFIFFANGMALITDEMKYTDFEGYVCDVSYWMTSIACFSVWEDECRDIQNDTDGCELLLWHVRKGLEVSSEKNNVLVYNKIITSTQSVERKDISYGLYHVFYENYFLLLKKYFDAGILSANTRDFLEKDLLYRFFLDWIIQWELGNADAQYSKEENLKKSVFAQYKDKLYWKDFLKKYKKRYIIIKLKTKINQLIGK